MKLRFTPKDELLLLVSISFIAGYISASTDWLALILYVSIGVLIYKGQMSLSRPKPGEGQYIDINWKRCKE